MRAGLTAAGESRERPFPGAEPLAKPREWKGEGSRRTRTETNRMRMQAVRLLLSLDSLCQVLFFLEAFLVLLLLREHGLPHHLFEKAK